MYHLHYIENQKEPSWTNLIKIMKIMFYTINVRTMHTNL